MAGLLYLLAFCGLGLTAAQALLPGQPLRVRLWTGLSGGMALLMFLPFAAGLVLGFKIPAHIVALVLAAGITAVLWFLGRRSGKSAAGPAALPELKSDPAVIKGGDTDRKSRAGKNGRPGKNGKAEAADTGSSPGGRTAVADAGVQAPNSVGAISRLRASLNPTDLALLIILVLAAVLFGVLYNSHILRVAADGGFHVGQATYGDLNLHLGIITSVAWQGDFPPDYSIFPGHAINYPFLVDSLSSSLLLMGMDLRTAVILPSMVLSLLLVAGFFMLARELTGSTAAAVLGLALFFLNGGFGFSYFMDGLLKDPANFLRQFSDFYHTPTNYNEHFVRWSNTICDMIIPQRTTLAGWFMAVLVFWLLKVGVDGKNRRWLLAAGLGAGIMPMMHTHSFFALGMASIAWAVMDFFGRKDKKEWFLDWLVFAGPALALALPQLFAWTFVQSSASGFLKLHFDWANEGDVWPWFWVKNVGVVFILLIPAWLSADKAQRRWYSGALVIFVVADLVLFQPNTYDNNKLFYIWYLFSAILVGSFLVRLKDKLKGLGGTWFILAGLVFLGTFSGVLTIGRELVSDYQLFSKSDVEAAEWIKAHTGPEDTFLTSDNHNNLVPVLTGRNIVCGTGVFLYFHGIDISERSKAVADMYAGTGFEALAKKYQVDWVVLGPAERGKFKLQGVPPHLAALPVAWQNREITIYSVKP